MSKIIVIYWSYYGFKNYFNQGSELKFEDQWLVILNKLWFSDLMISNSDLSILSNSSNNNVVRFLTHLYSKKKIKILIKNL